MNRPLNELNKKTSLAIRLFLATALMAALDIEPAAGGISAPTSRPLNARGTKVVLRTNSIAALAPPTEGGAVIPGRPPGGTPIPPPVVPLPPPSGPGITPISPNVPIPVGGPGGSPAPAPTITTISPNVPVPVGGPGGGIPSGGPGAS